MDYSRKDQFHNAFGALSRREREAAYELARAKNGPGILPIELLVQAHNYLSQQA